MLRRTIVQCCFSISAILSLGMSSFGPVASPPGAGALPDVAAGPIPSASKEHAPDLVLIGLKPRVSLRPGPQSGAPFETNSNALEHSLNAVHAQKVQQLFANPHGNQIRNTVDGPVDLSRVYRVHLPANADITAGLAELSANPDVTYAEPDYVVEAADDPLPTQAETPAPTPPDGSGSYPNDPRYPEQWALPAIGAPDAWAAMPADAASITVAVIDSGICADHPDLAGRIGNGWDFVDGDPVPQDDFGHGCSVSGIIAANINDGTGMAGVAPNAQIMPLRVLDSSGLGSYSDVAAAIVYAADNGAQVINLSLGGPSASSTLEQAVDYAVAQNVLVVAAAGNNGTESVLYPAAYPDAIAVGSVDKDLQHSSFSNYGPQVDIWAPGRDVLSTTRDGGYALATGTSFAAPYVAGAEAVLAAQRKQLALPAALLTLSNSVGTPTETPSVTTTPELSATPTVSTPDGTPSPLPETPAWLTYTDSLLGYAIEYPSSWATRLPRADQWGVAQFYSKPLVAPDSAKIEVGLLSTEYDSSQGDFLKWVLAASRSVTAYEKIALADDDGWLVSRHNEDGTSDYLAFAERGGGVYFAILYAVTPDAEPTYRRMLSTWSLPGTPQVDLNSSLEAQYKINNQRVAGVPDSGNEVSYYDLSAIAKYILPFGGQYKITQSGNGGFSHICPASEWQPNCGAIDIAAPHRTPLYAAYSGWLTFNDYDGGGFGNMLVIANDGSSTYSLYAHLDEAVLLRQSLHVKQGQLIGYSGNSGSVGNPDHLHFGVSLQVTSDPGTTDVLYLPVNISGYPGLKWAISPPCSDGGGSCGTAVGVPVLFADANYGGTSQAFGFYSEDFRNEPIGNDTVSSLKVPAGYTVRLYHEAQQDGLGVYDEYVGPMDVPNLSGKLVGDDQASAINVFHTIVCTADVTAEGCGGPTPTPIPTQPTPTLPPPSGGIEIVSVSSHVVSPGQQFNPSITIRHLSGELVANRDHLHAVPEDASNVFGAWPVQPLRSSVPIGGTYTFDVNNDTGFRMTAPSSPGQYQSVWQMRVGGNHVGPQAVINITVKADPIVTPPTPLPINCSDPPAGITLYEFPNFQGRCMNFTTDTMYLGNTYFGDNVASSLRVVGPWGVTVFRDPDWTGPWQEFSSNDSDLSDNQIGDNTISSLRVWIPGDPCGTLQQGVTLYRGRDFTGISQTFSRDAQFLGNELIGDNTVNSVRICGPYRVTLYRDADWTGISEDFTGSDSNLSDDPINDPNPTTSSLRIVDVNDACNSLPSGVTLYSETGFNGRSQTFSSDVMYLGNTSFGDNAAKSLRVCGHWTVTMFRDPDWTGSWENFTGPDISLTDDPLGAGTASSLRMVDSYDFCRTLGSGVILYRGRDFTGIAQKFTRDAMFFGNELIGDNTVTSIRQCGYNSRLYRDPDWQGFSEEFTGREESNLTDNQINTTSSSMRVWGIPATPTPTVTPSPTPVPGKPDLVPYDGSGWAFPLIPSSMAGDHWVGTLYAGQITYLDWSIFNNSNVNVTAPFKVTLYLDGTQVDQFSYSSLDANAYHGYDDWHIYVGTTGSHTLKILVDSNSEIAETNENNNVWEGTFYWNQRPEPATLTVNRTGEGAGTVTSDPVGINCGSDCAEDYSKNTRVTLTASAGPGSVFGGWTGGGCSGTSTCSVTMDVSKSVSAAFDLACADCGPAASPWPLYRQNALRNGRSSYAGPAANPTVLWSYDTHSYDGSSPAIGPDGTIYAGLNTRLYAFYPNGSIKWSYLTTGTVKSPAVAANGTIYAASDDGKMYALNANGTLKWSFTTGGWISDSAAISPQGILYFGSSDGELYALGPDGSLQWSYTIGSWQNPSPAIGADGTIYQASTTWNAYALSPAGELKWEYPTGNFIDASPAIGPDGTIYIGSLDHSLYALNPNGTQKWSYATAEEVGTPAVAADGTIYVGSREGRLHALNPNGTLKWSYLIGRSVHTPSVDSEGTILVGSDDGYLYAINPSGTLKWRLSLGGWLDSNPAIGANRVVYVASGGKLFAVGAVPVTHTISGNAGVGGAVLSYYDGTPKTVTANASGNYTITVPEGWYGEVTPSKPGYVFNPLSLPYEGVANNQAAQNYTASPGISVHVAGELKGTYLLSNAQSNRVSYAGVDSGPVVVTSTNGLPIVAAIRDLWSDSTHETSSVQVMGLPASLLSTSYYFPAYNNVSLDDQIRFGNVGTAPTWVTVKIGGVQMGSYYLLPSQSQRVAYAGVDSGPVVVSSSGGVKIIASIRDSWQSGGEWTSYSQLMGLPASQLSTSYYFPAYNNVSLDDQIRFGNVGTSNTWVTVTIAGVQRGSYWLAPNQSQRVSYAGVDSGPVVVSSSGGVKIIASIRDSWWDGTRWTSYSQLMGLPFSQLSTIYHFPAYENVGQLDGQLRFGNVGTAPTWVTVTIGGVNRGSYWLAPSGSMRVSYAGLDSGPVRVESSGGVKIIASLRDSWWDGSVWTSYSQLMGLPNGQLSASYYFPAYNNVSLDDQLRIAVP